MSKIKLNGKEYELPELDFEKVVELEDLGVNLMSNDITKKPLNTLIGFLALTVGSRELAIKESEGHILSGESFGPIYDAISDSIERSSFFQKQTEKLAKEPKGPQDHKKKAK